MEQEQLLKTFLQLVYEGKWEEIIKISGEHRIPFQSLWERLSEWAKSRYEESLKQSLTPGNALDFADQIAQLANRLKWDKLVLLMHDHKLCYCDVERAYIQTMGQPQNSFFVSFGVNIAKAIAKAQEKNPTDPIYTFLLS